MSPADVVEPELVILGEEGYKPVLYRYRPWGRKRPWYMAYGVLPRAFFERYYCGLHADIPEPGRPAVIVLSGNETNRKLLAHEYGHFLGFRHPPRGSLAYWTDLMGYGVRRRDRHGVMAKAQPWLDAHLGGAP